MVLAAGLLGALTAADRPDREGLIRSLVACALGILAGSLPGAGVMATGPHLGPIVIGAAPLMLVAGWLIGRMLRGTLRFWTDPATGRLKFRGGAVYFVILAASALSRVGLRYLLTGSVAGHSEPSGLVPEGLMVLTGSLLFMDTGLYLARAQTIASAAGERINWQWLRMTGGAR